MHIPHPLNIPAIPIYKSLLNTCPEPGPLQSAEDATDNTTDMTVSPMELTG